MRTIRPANLRPTILRHRRGFTLLELIVALAMASIIAGSLYTALRVGFKARNSAEAAVEPIRTAELATALLRADFESALPATGTLAGPFVGTDTTGEAGLPADTIAFFTLGNPADLYVAAQSAAHAAGGEGMNSLAPGAVAAPAPLPAEARKVEIGLVTYPGPGGVAEQVLVRRVTTNLLSQVEVPPDEEVLCRGVRGLNLRYFDGYAWQDSWDSTLVDDNIPSAVELVVELDRSRDGQPRILRFPRVFLLSCSTLSSTAPLSGTDAAAGTGAGAGTGGTGTTGGGTQ